MRPKGRLAGCVATLIALQVTGSLLAQGPVGDPELAKGIRQVDDGEYDTAILTLDQAARRLSSSGAAGSKDLAEAYLYLGIAYLAKGHETSAKARFREALTQVKDLRLSPELYAPRVVEVFEKAREEASARPAPAPARKGKGKTVLILGGLGGVAAGAVALAGGGSGGAGGNTSTEPSTSRPPEVFSGLLGSTGGDSASVSLGPYSAGACRAELSWTDARTEVRMFVNDANTGAGVAETRRLTSSSSVVEWSCGAGVRYRLDLFLQEPPVNVSYELRVTHP